MKGSIREQGEGSWELRVYLGRGSNGRKLYKSHTVKGTKRQAQHELNELLSKLQRGEYVSPNGPTRTTSGVRQPATPSQSWLTKRSRYCSTTPVHGG